MRTRRNVGARLGPGELWALGGALAYALNHVFLNVAVHGHELNYRVGAIVQSLPLLVFAFLMWPSAKRRDPEVISPFATAGVAASVIGNSVLMFVVAAPLLFGAFRAGGVLVTSPVTGTQVLWSALLAAAFLGERFMGRMALGMVVSVVGITVLAIGQSGGAQLSATWWIAIPYAAGAAFCWALGGVLLTYAMRQHVDRYQALAVFSVIGIALINVLLLAQGNMRAYAETPARVYVDLLVAGLFSTAALIGVTTGLSLTTVASTTTLNSLQVALAPLIAWIFVGEQMNGLIGLGILLVLGGVILVQRARVTGEPDETQGGASESDDNV